MDVLAHIDRELPAHFMEEAAAALLRVAGNKLVLEGRFVLFGRDALAHSRQHVPEVLKG